MKWPVAACLIACASNSTPPQQARPQEAGDTLTWQQVAAGSAIPDEVLEANCRPVNHSGVYDLVLTSTPAKSNSMRVPQCADFPTGATQRFAYKIDHDAFGAGTVINSLRTNVIIRDVKVLFDDVLPESCARLGSRRSPYVVTWREYWPPTPEQQRAGVQWQGLGVANTIEGKRELDISLGLTDSAGGMICFVHFD